MTLYLRLFLLSIFLYVKGEKTHVFVDHNWKFHFLPDMSMGMFLALAIPLENELKSTFLAYNVEATFALPANGSIVEWPPLVGRNLFDRKTVYEILETKIQSYGFSGKNCLLRTICEASAHTLQHNGVLADLLHIIFTPSTSKDKIADDYDKAEEFGRQNKCKIYHKHCNTSFLDLISLLGEAL